MLTSCAYVEQTEISLESAIFSEMTEIPAEILSSDIVTNKVLPEEAFVRCEYNGYIVLKTDISSFILSCQNDDAGNLTDSECKNIEYIVENMDSTNKAIMESLSAGREAVAEENARTYYAEISGLYEADGKTYMIRECSVMGSTVIYDLWCTDGDSVEYVGDFVSSEYVWMYPIKNGKSVIVTYEFTVRGFDYSKSPLIAANVYTIESGILTEYELESDKQFFWLYKPNSDGSSEENELYILNAIEEGYIFAPEDITELALKGKLNQEIEWDGDKIKIASGYGMEWVR